MMSNKAPTQFDNVQYFLPSPLHILDTTYTSKFLPVTSPNVLQPCSGIASFQEQDLGPETNKEYREILEWKKKPAKQKPTARIYWLCLEAHTPQ